LKDPVALCADAAAAWHESWLAALSLRSRRSDAVWVALDQPPFVYWTAITLARETPESAVADLRGTICDSWSALDLAARGFEEREREPWFLRPAADLPDERDPAGLEIVRVSTPAEVEEFEKVSLRGFGVANVEAGSIHPASVLADPQMTMVVGRVAQETVSAAMSYRTDDAIGIFGVTTIPSARGRGYASALTRALIEPALPAVLSPSAEAEGLYLRLGFAQVGELRQWTKRSAGG
jgi:hypothetical protein